MSSFLSSIILLSVCFGTEFAPFTLRLSLPRLPSRSSEGVRSKCYFFRSYFDHLCSGKIIAMKASNNIQMFIMYLTS